MSNIIIAGQAKPSFLKKHLLELVPEGEVLTVNGVEQTAEVTEAYNSIADKLNNEEKPNDFIQTAWVASVPTIALLDMAKSRLRSGLPIPQVLSKAIAGDKETAKGLKLLRKERKSFLRDNQSKIVAAIVDAKFKLRDADMTKAFAANKKGERSIKLNFVSAKGGDITEEDKAAVVGAMSIEQLKELLAKKEAEAQIIEAPASDLPAASPTE